MAQMLAESVSSEVVVALHLDAVHARIGSTRGDEPVRVATRPVRLALKTLVTFGIKLLGHVLGRAGMGVQPSYRQLYTHARDEGVIVEVVVRCSSQRRC